MTMKADLITQLNGLKGTGVVQAPLASAFTLNTQGSGFVSDSRTKIRATINSNQVVGAELMTATATPQVVAQLTKQYIETFGGWVDRCAMGTMSTYRKNAIQDPLWKKLYGMKARQLRAVIGTNEQTVSASETIPCYYSYRYPHLD